MGLTDPNLIESSGHTYERVNSISPEKHHAPNLLAPSHYGKDPIWSIAKDEAIRLCRVYDEEIGMMYPMLDIELIVERANKLFNSTENVTGTGSSDRTKLSADKIHGSEIDILKMILATTLTLEGDGQSELGSALFDTVRVAWENKLGEPIDIQGLRLLVIMVGERRSFKSSHAEVR